MITKQILTVIDQSVNLSLPAVPDPPRNLQLSCDNGEDGKVQVSWSPPDKGHGLIREYIVSPSHQFTVYFYTINEEISQIIRSLDCV